jgi:hypothetical protein
LGASGVCFSGASNIVEAKRFSLCSGDFRAAVKFL